MLKYLPSHKNSIWHLASGIWHLASGIWHLASGIWHLASGIWHLAVRLQAYWYSNQLLDSSGLQNKQKTLSTITPKKR
ncbi:TPA_asm: hypothetical protein G3V22_004427 [Salmonella enterica subsp. enterica serovar Napoli]|uniref:Uncharacterized protein n=1 Tax=Salmonella enterica subsp. enterica serovar Napoli TaxID=1151001 RepID=A0A727HX96_SALET|nr:hypothetical protein [Salmonella enterica subsp. enterica serovar Napoli]